MLLNDSQIDYVNKCKQIIGQTITKVEYAEIPYHKFNGQFPSPYYETHLKNVDTIDFSIYFQTKTNDIIEIYWDDLFFQYGLSIKINQASNSEFQKWDVSENELWKELLGTKILNLDIKWEKVMQWNEIRSKEFIYPQDYTLTFPNNKKIFIGAAGFLSGEKQKVFGMMDNLIVTKLKSRGRETFDERFFILEDRVQTIFEKIFLTIYLLMPIILLVVALKYIKSTKLKRSTTVRHRVTAYCILLAAY
jgi:hypothetical protein